MIMISHTLDQKTKLDSRLDPRQKGLSVVQGRPATVLVIESNDFLRRTLRWWLKTKFTGCSVVEASNGEEGIALARTKSPHVIIIDMTMPQEGQEIVTALRAAVSMVKIVALTFLEDEIDYADTTSNGVNVYISHEKIQTTLQPTLARLLATRNVFEGQRN